ncbi:ubiquitin carboxyl-terminal hydrolase 17-like protein 22 [Microcebus murinus]|uniref:ubiquitin carboxyl-terminal hydrolase 17-like protein 22 n=1 Tax=Microcebus murinus TaxID=30608 RepID=UPI003F6CA8C4
MEVASVHREDPDLYSKEAPGTKELAPRDKLLLTWKRPYGVGAGLWNVGNTCYMNAALQCLTYTPPLANYMLSREHSLTCHSQKYCMLCSMQDHITRALQLPGNVFKPSHALAAGFHRYTQEDAHEFLIFTVDGMKKACLSGHKPLDGHSEDTTLIHQIFGGYWRSQIKCLHCHGISDTFEPYLDIALDIEAAQSLNQALQWLVKPEHLDGEDAYHCGTCLKKVPASKCLTVHTASKVLMLVLKRFSDVTGNKIAKEVQYPECLDMQPYMSQRNRGPLVYLLYAVLVHSGSSCQSGHYFCYVKAGNGQWYKMDDAKVTACDISSVLSQHAYILFYIHKSELERDGGCASTGEKLRGRGPEDTDMGATQGGLRSDACIKVPELEAYFGKTTRELLLHQWKCHQEQNRPQPEFNSNGVMSPELKYRSEVKKSHAEQDNYLLQKPARDVTEQVSLSTDSGPHGGSTEVLEVALNPQMIQDPKGSLKPFIFFPRNGANSGDVRGRFRAEGEAALRAQPVPPRPGLRRATGSPWAAGTVRLQLPSALDLVSISTLLTRAAENESCEGMVDGVRSNLQFLYFHLITDLLSSTKRHLVLKNQHPQENNFSLTNLHAHASREVPEDSVKRNLQWLGLRLRADSFHPSVEFARGSQPPRILRRDFHRDFQRLGLSQPPWILCGDFKWLRLWVRTDRFCPSAELSCGSQPLRILCRDFQRLGLQSLEFCW